MEKYFIKHDEKNVAYGLAISDANKYGERAAHELIEYSWKNQSKKFARIRIIVNSIRIKKRYILKIFKKANDFCPHSKFTFKEKNKIIGSFKSSFLDEVTYYIEKLDFKRLE